MNSKCKQLNQNHSTKNVFIHIIGMRIKFKCIGIDGELDINDIKF